jgi:Glycosyl hydrolase family 9
LNCIAGEAASIAALVSDFPGLEETLKTRYRCLTVSQINYILGDSGRSFVVGLGERFPLAPHSREGFCAMDMDPKDCSYNLWFQEDAANPQIVVGAIVAGPNTEDQYQDSRSDRSSAIAIDFQSSFVSALTAAVTLPEEFWHGGDLGELEQACEAMGFKHYNWDS